MIAYNIMLFFGGVSVFMLGIRLLSSDTQRLFSDRSIKILKKCSSNKINSFFSGVMVSTVVQSSVAVNCMLINLTQNGILSLQSACACIVGTNVGTTLTTQIIAFSGGNMDFTGLACIIAFVGVILYCFKNQRIKVLGNTLTGFGFIFIGLLLITQTANYFQSFPVFANFICQTNVFILFIYGIIFPAVAQTSAPLTALMVVFASCGLINFKQCAFLLLGTNIGSCFGVVYTSLNQDDTSKKIALFNLYINILGAVVCIPLLLLFGKQITKFFNYLSVNPQRQIANFHTIYNVLTALVVLPFLNFFIKLASVKNPFKKFNGKPVKKRKFVDNL